VYHALKSTDRGVTCPSLSPPRVSVAAGAAAPEAAEAWPLDAEATSLAAGSRRRSRGFDGEGRRSSDAIAGDRLDWGAVPVRTPMV
jgi:hypothetical protein